MSMRAASSCSSRALPAAASHSGTRQRSAGWCLANWIIASWRRSVRGSAFHRDRPQGGIAASINALRRRAPRDRDSATITAPQATSKSAEGALHRHRLPQHKYGERQHQRESSAPRKDRPATAADGTARRAQEECAGAVEEDTDQQPRLERQPADRLPATTAGCPRQLLQAATELMPSFQRQLGDGGGKNGKGQREQCPKG